ncbi:MAG: alkaline phosphatase family protein [Candidatus Micrarchaeota archaeon]|nr:alkaline phosphatase family protein [Candidatus Micrarchaeota archaeon]MDE1847560.1 alkaline phosphatase family protein [Candidatus Micrarchaeota archaeon]MDE1864277.1 alkaline phosphatase family protein [Candidatus Micrarchaeota archaeon]
MGEKRFYLIGIDSTPLWLIRKLKGKYDLSGFEYLERNGALRAMRSSVPPVTSAAWPSIYTGLEPRDHQILEFSKIDRNYDKQLIYYDSSSPEPFWESLASMGLRCLVITPAVFLEARKREGVDMITGWPLQPRYSSVNLEILAKKFGFGGEPDIGVQLNSGKMSLDRASRLYTKSIKARAMLAQHLMSVKEYDMVFVCFTETDRMQHYSLSEDNWEEIVAPLYVAISDFINWTVSFAKKDSSPSLIAVVSDHGAQPIHHKFLPNSWLIDKGYAKLKIDPFGSGDVPARKAKSGIGKSMKVKISEAIASSSMRRKIYEMLPAALQKMGEKFLEENLEEGYGNDYIKILETDFEMRSTKAFASVSNGNMGMIWINDGRFSRSAVSAKEKPKLKGKLIEELKEIKALGKGKLMARVFDGESFYKGVTRFIPPDIVFQLSDGYTNDFSHYALSAFVEPEAARKGDHTMFGIFGIAGIGVRIPSPASKKELNLCNVAPTIKKYFGAGSKSRNSLI